MMHGAMELVRELLPRFHETPPAYGFAAELAGTAVRCAWESLVIAAFLSALLRWMPGLSPRASFRVWSAGFALAALLPLCRPGGDAVPEAILRAGYAFSMMPGAGVAAHRALTMPPVTFVLLSSAWAAGLGVLWAGASVMALARLAAGVWSLRRLLHAATPAPPAVEAMYRKLMTESGRSTQRTRTARLLVADGLAAPSACGLFGACIVLPRGLVESLSSNEMKGEEMECVLRHEAAHLRRWDDWLTVMARLVQAALPLAVALPYLERRMARAREMACDDAALGPGVSRREYAACLARLAESAATRPWHRLAPGLGGDGSQLAARVKHILRGAEPLRGPGRIRLTAAGCAGVLLSQALLAAPAFLSFTGTNASRPEMARMVKPAPALPAASPELSPTTLPPRLLPLRKIRSVRWSAPAARLRRRPPAFEVADGRAMRAGAQPTGMESSPRQSVLVLWDGKQDFSAGNLILLVSRPGGSPPPDWSDVFLLTI